MAATHDVLNRRNFLAGLGASTAIALAPDMLWAGEGLITALIAKAQAFPTIAKRIEFVSHALLGHRYQANTLVGGVRTPEVFVARDDRFDCMTFCETVLAAARAHDLPSFEAGLRAIRYHNGVVAWPERNHDFAAWCERNTAAGLCRPFALGEAVEIRKTMTVPRALGQRSYILAATRATALLAEKSNLQDGDIIGFVSRRSALDYFHTGFVMIGAKGDLLLRHASESHRRVVDERMTSFVAVNRVRYVTLLRPQEIG